MEQTARAETGDTRAQIDGGTAAEELVVDSPTPWVAKHINSYVQSNGQSGHLYHGMPTLLLTTRGRRSGMRRRTPLIYGEAGDSYLVVASNGGSSSPPAWYLNLTEDPAVDVQVGAEIFPAWARIATAAEKPLLWQQMASIFPTYDSYQAKAGRDIPVVILDRA
jgi:deazaflavin-dependent oxidoreductase (nitroreductase family)